MASREGRERRLAGAVRGDSVGGGMADRVSVSLDLPSDVDLVARAAGGDGDAYAALVARYEDLVYTVAVRVIGDEDDARDVAQETFIRAHRALPRFRGDSKFSSWLYRIAVNRALTHLKRNRRRGISVDIDGTNAVESSALDPPRQQDPGQRVVDEEFRLSVRSAVAELPPKYRAVVALFYLEERSYKEVTEILGIPMGTLKTHLHRARQLLREKLEDHDPESGR